MPILRLPSSSYNLEPHFQTDKPLSKVHPDDFHLNAGDVYHDVL